MQECSVVRLAQAVSASSAANLSLFLKRWGFAGLMMQAGKTLWCTRAGGGVIGTEVGHGMLGWAWICSPTPSPGRPLTSPAPAGLFLSWSPKFPCRGLHQCRN